MDKFIQRLMQMSHLEAINITFGDFLFDCFPDFGNALTTLMTLRRLTICHVGLLTCEVLKDMQPGLVSVDFGWVGHDEGFFRGELPYDKWPEYHPVPLLAKWSSTLERISGLMWYTSRGLTPFKQVYPKMREFSIERDDYPLIAPYICAFPNLRTLYALTDHFEDIDDDDAVRSMHEHHALNVRSQQEGGIAGTTWHHLQEYTSTLVDLYVLGLACRIPHIFFHTDIDKRHCDMLSTILAYARPVRLKIKCFRDPFLTHSSPTRDFAQILQDPGASALESLVVVVELQRDSRDVDVAAALDMLAQSLKRLPLRHLRLCVCDDGLDPTPPSPGPVAFMLAKRRGDAPPKPHRPMPFTPAEVSLETFDVDEFTRGLADAIPSLCDAVVQVSAPRGCFRIAKIKRGTTCEDFGLDSRESEMWEI
ncbi:hypothetical protein C8Q76DRAFT_747278 [Earliella scabrosa]|nr:hypothetical protein C8Q76DRAFT_747278 [Earliella scabrosa]